jgi:hypothetical protein
MHYKTNRLNHDFQIAYFIAGSCQTPDAAYAILCDLKEDRSNALKGFEAHKLREQAKIIRAERMIANEDEAVQLEGRADLAEIGALSVTTHANYLAAQDELAMIEKCMMAVQPLRKYAHLPDSESHEAAQFEEWKLQLIHTAENQLLSHGVIQADHWSTMRMHPSFATEILPALDETKKLMQAASMSVEGSALLTSHLARQSFDLPALLLENKSK